MPTSKNRYFGDQFEALAHEISKLAIACNIDLNTPELAERILRNDASVCGRSNERAFQQLRHHLMAFYPLEERAIDRLGAAEIAEMLQEIKQAIRRLRELGHSGGAPTPAD